MKPYIIIGSLLAAIFCFSLVLAKTETPCEASEDCIVVETEDNQSPDNVIFKAAGMNCPCRPVLFVQVKNPEALAGWRIDINDGQVGWVYADDSTVLGNFFFFNFEELVDCPSDLITVEFKWYSEALDDWLTLSTYTWQCQVGCE